MKAAIYNQYGGPEVVSIKEIEKPIPSENEALVKVKASTLTLGDSVMRKGEPFASRFVAGLTKPKNPILGHEFSGEVVEIGKSISRYKVGDVILGSLGMKSGSHAEYITISEKENTVKLPEGIDPKDAAAISVGGMTAMFFLKKGEIKKGQKVLINGASGSIGTYAVQLAKYFGAEVTAVSSAGNRQLVNSIGADHFVDYRTIDFTKGDQKFDLIFDAVGKLNFSKGSKVLNDEGYFVTTAVKASTIFQMVQSNLSGKKKMFAGIIKENQEDLELIVKLISEGTIRAVIDRTYDLENIDQAHEYVDAGHKKGNVIISLN